MDLSPKAELERAMAGALAWWRDAGLDCCLADEPTDWLARPEPDKAAAQAPAPAQAKAPAPVPAEPAIPALDPALFPRDIGLFRQWWLSEPALDAGRLSGRVPPRGQPGARLMAIVAYPEEQDAGQLLSGPQGALLDSMARAMGLGADDLYVASVLPRHMPLPDWAGLGAQGFGALAAHHVALVRPERIIAFGGNNLPLAGNDLPNSTDALRRFNHEGLNIPLWSARDLGELLARHAARARFWRDWLEWTGN